MTLDAAAAGTETATVNVVSGQVITSSNDVAVAVLGSPPQRGLADKRAPTFTAAVQSDNTVLVTFSEDVAKSGGGDLTNSEFRCVVAPRLEGPALVTDALPLPPHGCTAAASR